ncbi:MAG TPA: hypothetical protein VGB13_01630, partial [Candidatus Krumholzibacteria bacterium]
LDELAEIAAAAVHARNVAREERDTAVRKNEGLRYALRLAADTLENSRTDLQQRIRAGKQIREMLNDSKRQDGASTQGE